MMLLLIVASGPDKGKVHEFQNDQSIVIGREADDVLLDDRKASRKHARLKFTGGRWHVKDLGSRHGTYHNHERLEGEAEVHDGDLIQCGRTVMVLAQVAESVIAGAAVGRPLDSGVHPLDAREDFSMPEEAPSREAIRAELRDEVRKELLSEIQRDEPTPVELPSSLGRHAKLAMAASIAAGGLVVGGTVLTITSLNQRIGELEALVASRSVDPAQMDRLTEGQRAIDEQLSGLDSSVDGIAAALPEPGRPMLARLEETQLDRLRNPQLESLLNEVQIALQQQTADGPAIVNAASAVADQLAGLDASIRDLRSNLQTVDESIQFDDQLAALAAASEQQQTLLTRLTDQFSAAESALAAAEDAGTSQIVAKLDLLPTLEQHQQLTQTLSDLNQAIADAANAGPSDSAVAAESQRQEVLLALQAASEQSALSIQELRDQVGSFAADLQTSIASDNGDAAPNAALMSRLDDVLARLDALPTDASIAAALGERDDAMTAQLDAVLARLDNLPQGGLAADELRALVEADPRGTNLETALTQIATRLDAADALGERLDTLSSRLDARADETLAAVERAMTGRATETQLQDVLTSIDQLRATLPDASDAASTAAPSLDRLTQAVAGLQVKLDETTTLAAGQRSGLEQLLTAVHDLRLELPGRPDSAAAFNTLVASVDELRRRQTQSADLLVQLSDTVGTRQRLAGIRDDLTTVAASSATSEDWVAQTLIDILQQLEAMESAAPANDPAVQEALSVSIQSLREGQELPAGSREQLDLVLQSIDELPFEVYEERMRQILSAVREQTGPDLDGIRAVVREELAMALDPNADHSLASIGSEDSGLTEMESAFRQAFLSGRSVSFGNRIDPNTGDLLPGRTLDPAEAYDAGYENWRAWYEADARLERDRLNQQSLNRVDPLNVSSR